MTVAELLDRAAAQGDLAVAQALTSTTAASRIYHDGEPVQAGGIRRSLRVHRDHGVRDLRNRPTHQDIQEEEIGMFDIFGMMGNYEDRKIRRDYIETPHGEAMVSTCHVTDSAWPIETAVAHPLYNDGDIIIVDNAQNEDSAVRIHEEWVKMIVEDTLPDEIVDKGEANITGLGDLLGPDDWRLHRRKK